MSDLRELYQQVILDHNRQPRNFRVIDPVSNKADGHNPLCGDKVTVFVEVEGDVIKDVAFQGRGCAISTASASLMTDIVKGKTLAEAQHIFESFHDVVTDKSASLSDLGKLAVLAGVRDYPSRVKCATLAWHTMHAALTDNAETVVTE